MWKLPNSKENQVRFGFARSFKQPWLRSLIPNPRNALNNTFYTPDTRGNPSLKPEIASGLDLAFEHFGNDGLVLSTSVYAKQLKQVIRTDLSSVGGRWVQKEINGGNANTHGIEFDAKFPAKLV